MTFSAIHGHLIRYRRGRFKEESSGGNLQPVKILYFYNMIILKKYNYNLCRFQLCTVSQKGKNFQ